MASPGFAVRSKIYSRNIRGYRNFHDNFALCERGNLLSAVQKLPALQENALADGLARGIWNMEVCSNTKENLRLIHGYYSQPSCAMASAVNF